ncbi:MAG: HEAT repeat domain-containing protein [Planctomycetes bacterium]|nr:HEAT repeat domain-containing protein [Planctomycetota bacterium]
MGHPRVECPSLSPVHQLPLSLDKEEAISLFGAVYGLGWATFIVLAVYAVILDRRRKREIPTPWLEAARRLGLRLFPEEWGRSARMNGLVDGLEIEATCRREPQGVAESHGGSVAAVGMPKGLAIGSENLFTVAAGALGGRDLQLGHAWFDKEIRIDGPEAETLALLDEDCRRSVLSHVKRHAGRISGGRVSYAFTVASPDASRIVRGVHEAAGIARLLSLDGKRVQELLLRNVQLDSIPGVRERNFEVLVRDFPNSEEAVRACDSMLERGCDPGLLLRAADGLGARGWPILIRLSGATTMSEAARLAALERLIAQLPREELLPVLERALASAESASSPAAAAIRAFGRLAHMPALGSILPLAGSAEPAIATAVAEALADFGELDAVNHAVAQGAARIEAALIGLLQHTAVRARLAAAKGLGRVGSVGAVEALLACWNSGQFLQPEVAGAAREAARKIQARVGAVNAGRLSLADVGVDAGSLSLACPEGGLSLADRRAGECGAALNALLPVDHAPTEDAGTGSGGEESGPGSSVDPPDASEPKRRRSRDPRLGPGPG